ncbi:hypothetical protein Gotur_003034 [Gossypium turneri]
MRLSELGLKRYSKKRVIVCLTSMYRNYGTLRASV